MFRKSSARLGLFAILGTVLAVIGVYGVISYLVALRTQELGVRVAPGAGSREILWLILRQRLSMGFGGVALGIAGAIVVRRFVASFLYRVSGTDPVTLGVCSAILLAVVAAASMIPAIRATHIDPVRALRAE